MNVCERVNSRDRRLFVEQIVTVVALGCGRKVDVVACATRLLVVITGNYY